VSSNPPPSLAGDFSRYNPADENPSGSHMTIGIRLRAATESDLPLFFENQRDPDATGMPTRAAMLSKR